jgi:uncharacterized protein
MAINEVPANLEDPFAFLAPHQFAVLTTYRKDGTPVPTTIWFVYDGGNVYFTTQKQTGKIKRLHRNAQVKLTPSDRVGNTQGLPEVAGKAVELPPEDFEHARALFRQKYEQFNQIVSNADSSLRTYIIIQP